MPQESQTANLISRHQAGILLNRSSEIAPIIRRLAGDSAEHAAMRMAAAKISVPDATKRIVHELMRQIEDRAPTTT
jgi:UDP-N-acetylglucosamine:LPS N-acetylglucosamine transferase